MVQVRVRKGVSADNGGQRVSWVEACGAVSWVVVANGDISASFLRVGDRDDVSYAEALPTYGTQTLTLKQWCNTPHVDHDPITTFNPNIFYMWSNAGLSSISFHTRTYAHTQVIWRRAPAHRPRRAPDHDLLRHRRCVTTLPQPELGTSGWIWVVRMMSINDSAPP